MIVKPGQQLSGPKADRREKLENDKAHKAFELPLSSYNKLLSSQRKTENGKNYVKVNGEWRLVQFTKPSLPPLKFPPLKMPQTLAGFKINLR